MEIYHENNLLSFIRNELQNQVNVYYHTQDDTSDDDISDDGDNVDEIDDFIYGYNLPLLDLDNIKYVNIYNYHLIPLTPTGVIDNDDIEELYNMSDDFAENNRILTFWYVTYFDSIYAVFRHSELFN